MLLLTIDLDFWVSESKTREYSPKRFISGRPLFWLKMRLPHAVLIVSYHCSVTFLSTKNVYFSYYSFRFLTVFLMNFAKRQPTCLLDSSGKMELFTCSRYHLKCFVVANYPSCIWEMFASISENKFAAHRVWNHWSYLQLHCYRIRLQVCLIFPFRALFPLDKQHNTLVDFFSPGLRHLS